MYEFEAKWMCVCVMCACSPIGSLCLLLGTGMGLPVCACVLRRCTWCSAGKMRGCVLPGTAKFGFGRKKKKRGPSTFWCVPLFIHVLPIRWLRFIWWALEGQKYDRHKTLYTQQPEGTTWTFSLVCMWLYPCVLYDVLFLVFLHKSATVSSCLHIYSQPLVPRLLLCELLKLHDLECSSSSSSADNRGFLGRLKLHVLQGLTVKKATRAEIQCMTTQPYGSQIQTLAQMYTQTESSSMCRLVC